MRPLIFERSQIGVHNEFLPNMDEYTVKIDKNILAETPVELPEVGEFDIIRHYTELSKLNFSVDGNFYPLGSCTMKYNPKINEEIASHKEFAGLHPLFPQENIQGILEIMYLTAEYLKDISGLPGVSLTPSAGAHGELAGNFIIAKYFMTKNEKRKNIMIPDSAHGTNPATVSMAGFTPIPVRSNDKGEIDIEHLISLVDENTAGIMMTQPNTLGIFDSNFEKISEIIHNAGAIVYMDGANMNAMLCRVKPGEIGVDIMHYNLHKTFSTPHGMGGPGSGPIAVRDFLCDYLPIPVVRKKDDIYYLDNDIKHSIGTIKEFYGNIGVVVKSLVYMLALGVDGMIDVCNTAVLNANYLKSSLKDHFNLKYPGLSKHEFVFDNTKQKDNGIRTLDIAKRLLDLGIHSPTVYFPLIVNEAIMIEPTETESKYYLDSFIGAMKRIADEAKDNPQLLKNAPLTTPVKRLDEVRASKTPIVKWTKKE